jgi:hypothetical protein
MRRISLLCLLLLPVLAACADQRPKANLDIPIPVLSDAGALDSGKVTPITRPVIVRYAPFPAASFERLLLARATDPTKTLASMERVAGTTFAEARGDLIAITFIVKEASWNGNLPFARGAGPSLRGMKVILLVPPYGPVGRTDVSLPRANVDRAQAETIQNHLRQEFSNADELPEAGFRQDETTPISETYPTRSADVPDSFEGRATVEGQGSYRGRPVVVFDLTGVGIVNGQPMGMHAHLFLDTATGLVSHTELLAEGTPTVRGDPISMRLRVIDDIRF